MSEALQSLDQQLRARVRRAAVPRTFAPMKAVLFDQPFSDEEWLFERKLDGVRCAAFREDGAVRLVSRSGKDLSGAYPELVEALDAGHDLTALPLRARKSLLRTALAFPGRVRFTPHRNADGQGASRRACARAGRA